MWDIQCTGLRSGPLGFECKSDGLWAQGAVGQRFRELKISTGVEMGLCWHRVGLSDLRVIET